MNTQGGGGSQEDPRRVPGTADTDYHWNSGDFYQYLYGRGHRVVRIDFLWERVQLRPGAELNDQGVMELREAVRRAEDAGLLVILDMKNYGRYWLADDTQAMLGRDISIDDFAGVWKRLAESLSDQSAVVAYGLMNEPWGLDAPGVAESPSVWQRYSQAAVEAIRSTGDERAVFVAGDEWSGVWNWAQENGEPWIDDPIDNVYYEAHIYFDANTSGTYVNSYEATESDAVARGWDGLEDRVASEIGNYTAWLAEHEQRGFVGEIGWPSGTDAAEWNTIGELAYQLLNDAEVGATYWATGEWLATDGGMYALDAYNRGQGEPQAQAEVIEFPCHQSLLKNDQVQGC
ncbi:glycoside hydrolase family 5 protein [Modestobacter sp. VKM Ac-2985]|uniref:glycoside hydrolase family 5 protein n=1 Tax=Modestobacter sp. VKM Ac-2985 TaxID=3004139 RepID=UPI0022AB75EF|nr:cellulase family glycosylhydrolase [Modestobacter sp. VKM Ac-2985]MCZ2836043.1 cellulase family glycosylhydrolase [Modestobacter sp. VKM Ac-2985]